METTIEEEEIVVVLTQILHSIEIFLVLFMHFYESRRRRRLLLSSYHTRSYSLIGRAPDQRKHMHELVGLSDTTALDTIRMSRDTFGRLFYLLENIGGLTPTRNIEVREQVAMCLNILAHHTKNVVIRKCFKRSTFTISKYFHRVLLAIIRLYPILLVTPKPAGDVNDNPRWNLFKVLSINKSNNIILQTMKLLCLFGVFFFFFFIMTC